MQHDLYYFGPFEVEKCANEEKATYRLIKNITRTNFIKPFQSNLQQQCLKALLVVISQFICLLLTMQLRLEVYHREIITTFHFLRNLRMGTIRERVCP